MTLFFSSIFSLVLINISTITFAEPTPLDKVIHINVSGQWVRDAVSKKDLFRISLTQNIDEKQKELINSGFSTFSNLVVKGKNENGKEEILSEVSCTAKFDLWEEQYEVARVGSKKPEALLVPTFPKYSSLCLEATIPASIAKVQLQRGLSAELHIDQISAAKAGEIKEWLVRQQSGVMKGIFSHMLGDLKLSETLKVTVIEPKPGGEG